ncbi:MAG: hypothetical protein ACP5G6_04280 [Conexivisphaera sp.]
MKVVLGVPDSRLPVWELGVPVMINQLSWSSTPPWDNETWVDSGGYQTLIRGARPSLRELIRRYRSIDADYYISLDVPTLPCSSPARETLEYYEELYSHDLDVVPVIHAYPPEHVDSVLDFYRKYPPRMYAYGGIAPPSSARGAGRHAPIVIFHYLRRSVSAAPLHVLGAGSPAMMAVYRLADSVDTSTYRVKAIHGMVIVPGKGERYVGLREIRWHVRRATEEELEALHAFLESTGYPYTVRLDSWRSRALVNAWILVHARYDGEFDGVRLSGRLTRMSDVDLRDYAESLCSRKGVHAHLSAELSPPVE